MHNLPKMQCFCWFSFCQVDEENSGETMIIPVSVKLTKAYGINVSGRCRPKEASCPMALMAGYVSSLSFSSLLSVLPPALLALLSLNHGQRADWAAVAQGQLQGSHPAARDKGKCPVGLLSAIVPAGLGAGVSDWVGIQRKEARSRKESSGFKLNFHLEGQLQMLQIS